MTLNLILVVVISLIVIIFSIQNSAPVTVAFFSWSFSAPVAMVVVLSVLCGMIIASLLYVLIGTKRLLQKKKERTG